MASTQFDKLLQLNEINSQIQQIENTGRLMPPGGSIGQVLAKYSNINYDVYWTNVIIPNAGSVLTVPLTNLASDGVQNTWARSDHTHAVADSDNINIYFFTSPSNITIPNNINKVFMYFCGGGASGGGGYSNSPFSYISAGGGGGGPFFSFSAIRYDTSIYKYYSFSGGAGGGGTNLSSSSPGSNGASGQAATIANITTSSSLTTGTSIGGTGASPSSPNPGGSGPGPELAGHGFPGTNSEFGGNGGYLLWQVPASARNRNFLGTDSKFGGGGAGCSNQWPGTANTAGSRGSLLLFY